ncbi:MAG: GcrA cell cycle regulator [Phenylobacterium sp.]|uniref:GcrA family cell cycle regulator n=1 Tax=Phenylobacterium sp. TaxID=1871053 RepID=UPI0025CC8251|nr:GcrA family cell cycle regulator [Phenylobacterium sp.]MBI1200359.1 GcrA cell cycle regulator [Phenylobacterium sp.]
MSTASDWTDARVELLSDLWREGLSASQIARRLGGVTRNAVIGKVHRLGLSGRARASTPGTRRPKVRRERRLRIIKPVPAAAFDRPAIEPPASGGATVLSVRRGQCRWPIGEPRHDDFRLCGRAATRGAYCAAHGALAYRPVAPDHLLRLAGLS